VSDPVVKSDIECIRARLESGATLQQAIVSAQSFPPVLIQLITVGEKSGQLANFLSRAADVCADAAEQTLLRIATLAEPAMIIAFGTVVGFVAVSLLQAVYSVNGSVLR